MKYVLTVILTTIVLFTGIKIGDVKEENLVNLGIQGGLASTGIFRAPNQSGNLDNIKTSGGVLDSVVITGASTGVLNFYDATTTNASIRFPQATSSLQVVASFPASTAANSYLVNVAFTNGLITGIIGTTPTTTITYR